MLVCHMLPATRGRGDTGEGPEGADHDEGASAAGRRHGHRRQHDDPQVTYQDQTIGPNSDSASSVSPRLRTAPVNGSAAAEPTPRTTATSSPRMLKTGRASRVENGTWTDVTDEEAARATMLTGVTPVKDASAVVVVRTQPHPVPEIKETHSSVANAIRPATAGMADATAPGSGRSGPHPAEEHHAEGRG